jgi:hypothetical protein
MVERAFSDETGTPWTATVRRRDGTDYQGRYHLVLREPDGGAEVELQDVRWNSEYTARRTLETMSEVELRRRLRSARGRAGGPVGG